MEKHYSIVIRHYVFFILLCCCLGSSKLSAQTMPNRNGFSENQSKISTSFNFCVSYQQLSLSNHYLIPNHSIQICDLLNLKSSSRLTKNVNKKVIYSTTQSIAVNQPMPSNKENVIFSDTYGFSIGDTSLPLNFSQNSFK